MLPVDAETDSLLEPVLADTATSVWFWAPEKASLNEVSVMFAGM